MFKHYLSTAVALFISASVFGINLERVETRNGSVYDGYIHYQVPGKYIEINAERACIQISPEQLSFQRVLPDSYFEIGERHIINDICGESSEYNVGVVEIDGNHFDNAVIFGEDDNIYALILEKNRYRIEWPDLFKTKKFSSGRRITKDILILKDGSRVEGQVFEQIIGESISFIPDSSKDTLIRFATRDIQEIRTEFYDNSASVLEQSEYMDIVTLSDSREIEGFILSRKLGDKVIMLDNENREISLSTSQITSYRKVVKSDDYDYSMAGLGERYAQLTEADFDMDSDIPEDEDSSLMDDTSEDEDSNFNDDREEPVKKSSTIVIDNGNARYLKAKKNKRAYYISGIPMYVLSVGDKIEVNITGDDIEGTEFNDLILLKTKEIVLESKLASKLDMGIGEEVLMFTKKDINAGMAPCIYKRHPFVITFTEPGIYALYPYSEDGNILVFTVK